ncbi:MAG: hypothetical protein ACOC83_01935 [Gemmatimonadota bacterium]
MSADALADLFAALEEAVDASDTLLLLDRSPPGGSRSPSMTVGAEEGEEASTLSVTFEPDHGQIVFRGTYWRSGEFTPDMRERHGLLFRPAALRLDDEGFRFSDPRHGAPPDDEGRLERYGTAREAAGALLEILEDFHGKVEERAD